MTFQSNRLNGHRAGLFDVASNRHAPRYAPSAHKDAVTGSQPTSHDATPDMAGEMGPAAGVLRTAEWRWLSDHLALSPREMDVVQHIFQGHSEARAAFLMDISIDTVHTYVRRAYQKLDVHDQKELILHIVKVYLEHFVRNQPPAANGEGPFTTESAEEGADLGSDQSGPNADG